MMKKRPSAIAGRWYPGDAEGLRSTIEGFLQKAKEESGNELGEVRSIVVPHAGYVYSGQVAARAYAAIEGMHFDLVVVCSPLHAYHPAAVLTSAHMAYETPLGDVPIATEVMRTIGKNFVAESGEKLLPIGFDEEHALEIQLPFLQTVLADEFELVPLMVRSRDGKVLAHLAEAVVKAVRGKRVLFVASTDLSHFYPKDEAKRFDEVMVGKMLAMDAVGVLRAEEEGRGFACGASSVATVLMISKLLGSKQAALLGYATSGDVTGDDSNVVGYASLAILG